MGKKYFWIIVIVISLLCLLSGQLLISIVLRTRGLQTMNEDKEKAYKRDFDKELALIKKDMADRYREERAYSEKIFKELEAARMKMKEVIVKRSDSGRQE